MGSATRLTRMSQIEKAMRTIDKKHKMLKEAMESGEEVDLDADSRPPSASGERDLDMVDKTAEREAADLEDKIRRAAEIRKKRRDDAEAKLAETTQTLQ